MRIVLAASVTTLGCPFPQRQMFRAATEPAVVEIEADGVRSEKPSRLKRTRHEFYGNLVPSI